MGNRRIGEIVSINGEDFKIVPGGYEKIEKKEDTKKK